METGQPTAELTVRPRFEGARSCDLSDNLRRYLRCACWLGFSLVFACLCRRFLLPSSRALLFLSPRSCPLFSVVPMSASSSDKELQLKVAQYEHFIENTLKRDLAACINAKEIIQNKHNE